jgi:SRSO17 transposase
MDVDFGDAAIEERFSAYVDALGAVLGHADRMGPFAGYVTGLLLPLARKSVEPMAARLAPERTGAAHQSLLHLVGVSPWRDAALLAAVRRQVVPALEAAGGIAAWIVDDTSFPKKGRHSVGVTRQYCGELGKRENCQVAVAVSLANARASLPVAWGLYLPKPWAGDDTLRCKAGIPAEIGFRTKPAIALEQLRDAVAQNLPRGVVLADAAYGTDMGFRQEVRALGLCYAVAIQSSTTAWAPGTGPLPPSWSGQGRPPRNLRRRPDRAPVSVKDLAVGLPEQAWRTVTWREGTNTPLRSRFTRLRIRPAHRDYWRAEPWPEEWLLVEWPEDAAEPTKYWLSTLAKDTPLDRMVELAKLRWRIERDYRELKQEVGLGHFEGRGWRGFHHHATLCIAAYGFLVRERLLFSPSGHRADLSIKEPPLPEGFRPRGAPDPDRTARAPVHRDPANPDRRPTRQTNAKMPLLPATSRRTSSSQDRFVTQ